MWLSNDILVLSFATLDFVNKSILWNAGEWTPKRANCLNAVLDAGFVQSVNSLEAIF